jgi:phenylacetate-CoA ligase
MVPSPPPYRPPLTAHRTIAWPALPAAREAQLAAILFQLEHSQWWTAAQHRERQLVQAAALLEHAYRQVPFYRERLAQAGYLPGKALTPEVWARIPRLTRAELQQAGPALVSPQLPDGHGKTYEVSTSGSTGRPIKAVGSAVVQLIWHALTLREHLWHRRDFSGRLAAIRSLPSGTADYPKGSQGRNWGRSTQGIFETGPAAVLTIASRTDEQAEWLQRVQPDYLLTYPSALRDLLLYCREQAITLPRLREVRTLSELLPAETRQLCREVWGLKIADMYSTQETGYLALQCPEQEHYHVQSEACLVEVLNGAGEPCGPGEVGEVAVTPLMNFAMPMIRYLVGDLAEVGGPCACGRGLPVLKRILGRVRDMLVYPDGRKSRPRTVEMWEDGALAIRQMQIIQHALNDIEIKLVTVHPFSKVEEKLLSDRFRQSCGEDFPIRITYHQEIPRGPGGKFADFLCEIRDESSGDQRD